mmetsp:Transcript_14545/g.39857  ORF Transcript_14545/g.39857 Transcript_14545/m.39857 type:complete len:265 (-) Transcript_14545:1118-1912(-)
MQDTLHDRDADSTRVHRLRRTTLVEARRPSITRGSASPTSRSGRRAPTRFGRPGARGCSWRAPGRPGRRGTTAPGPRLPGCPPPCSCGSPAARRPVVAPRRGTSRTGRGRRARRASARHKPRTRAWSWPRSARCRGPSSSAARLPAAAQTPQRGSAALRSEPAAAAASGAPSAAPRGSCTTAPSRWRRHRPLRRSRRGFQLRAAGPRRLDAHGRSCCIPAAPRCWALRTRDTPSAPAAESPALATGLALEGLRELPGAPEPLAR